MTEITRPPGYATDDGRAHRRGSDDGSVSINALLATAVQERPSDPFLTFEGATLHIGSMERRVQEMSERLSALGVERGHRVVYVLPTTPAAVVLFLAVIRLGALAVPVDWRTKSPQLNHVLRDAQPQLVLVDEHLYPLLSADGALEYDASDAIDLGLGAEATRLVVLSSTHVRAESPVVGSQSGAAAIIYTSGTSGPPKGVLVTEHMFVAAARGVIAATAPRAGDVFFQWEPFHHIGGLQMPIVCLLVRSSVSLVRTFSASRFWKQVRDARATHIHYLGGVLQILLAQPRSDGDSSHAVRIAWGAGCSQGSWRRFEERFGVEIREVYGMTETASINTANLDRTIGSIGRPLDDFDVKLVGENGAEVLGRGSGEVWIRGRCAGLLTPGYFRNESATAALYDGEWLRTSDFAYKDEDGNLFFLGRKGDVIRRRGENISAWEVEHIVREHPTIKDCAVIGVPNKLLEDQDIALFIESKEDAVLDIEEFVSWCDQRLPRHQVPRFITIVSEFPRGPSYRILKNMLPRDFEDAHDVDVVRNKGERTER